MRRPYCTLFVRGLLIFVTMLGCDSPDPTTPTIRDASQLYSALRMNHKAVMLSVHAPYDTVQLRAVPISFTGDTLAYEEAVKFTRLSVLDTSVQVDSMTGMVIARASTNSTRVIARLTIGAITQVDTVVIMVRSENPIRQVSRMEFFPPATDSNWRWGGDTRATNVQPWIRLFDGGNTLIPASQAVTFLSVEKPAVFGAEGGFSVAANTWRYLIGETWLYAQVYAYGKQFLDSVLFRRIDPPVKLVVVDRVAPTLGEESIAFFPGTVTAKAGATIVFMNRFGHRDRISTLTTCTDCGNRIRRSMEYPLSELIWVDSVDIIFDNPAQAKPGSAFGSFPYPGGSIALIADGSEGNIPPFALMYCTGNGTNGADCGGRGGGTLDRGYRTRRFDTPGTYRYSSSRFPGAQGTIIITE